MSIIAQDICSFHLRKGIGYDIIKHIPTSEIIDVIANKLSALWILGQIKKKTVKTESHKVGLRMK